MLEGRRRSQKAVSGRARNPEKSVGRQQPERNERGGKGDGEGSEPNK